MDQIQVIALGVFDSSDLSNHAPTVQKKISIKIRCLTWQIGQIMRFSVFFLRLSSQIGQNNFLCLNWRIKQTNVEFFVPELKGLKKPRLTFSACLHIGQIKDFFLYFFCAWLDRPEKSAFLQQLLMLDLTELSNYLFFQKNLVPAWHTWQIKNILLITS
jgi:hypothetical protein